ncbi:hypothetical protein DSO57_1037639 [Entomophthora muscae]|uniref:Uncharacterized protein n=1 Tax=Entomophthora muscae TaxID=34485 RepID=A0ACC2T9Y6_9FUNG|nr:hypothetical protein DSO57_1037639 [Entomophthora muscae]
MFDTHDSKHQATAEKVLNYIKLCLTLTFLIEIVVRILVMGVKYWKSVWGLVDFVAVVTCAAIEVLAVFLNKIHFVRYDILFIGFRVWYALRMHRMITLIKVKREERALKSEEDILAEIQKTLEIKELQSKQMETDLLYMQQIINQDDTKPDHGETDPNIKNCFSWYAFVPHCVSIKTKSPIIRRAMSAPVIKKAV